MNPSEFSQRLFWCEPDSPEMTTLARELVDDARYPAKVALERYLSSSEEGDQLKAKNLLADMGELALVPMAESPSDSNLDTELWSMRTMADALVTLRNRTASVLQKLLENRHLTSGAPDEPAATPYPHGTRVCDLAYVMLHRVLHVESSPSAFLTMGEVERDKQIREFQKSPEFNAAFASKS